MHGPQRGWIWWYRPSVPRCGNLSLLGRELPARVRDAVSAPVVRLTAGISDGLPKLVVRWLMEPVVHEQNLRRLCREEAFADLLAGLALHRLDVLRADQPAPSNANVKLHSHPLGSSRLGWYAPQPRFTLRRGAASRSHWHGCRYCCRPAMPPCATSSPNGLSGRQSARESLENSKTAHC